MSIPRAIITVPIRKLCQSLHSIQELTSTLELRPVYYPDNTPQTFQVLNTMAAVRERMDVTGSGGNHDSDPHQGLRLAPRQLGDHSPGGEISNMSLARSQRCRQQNDKWIGRSPPMIFNCQQILMTPTRSVPVLGTQS